MEIDRHVRGGRVVPRRFDVAHGPPRRRGGNILRHVRPGLAGVARQLHQAVVGAGPDQSLLRGDSAIANTTPAYCTRVVGVSRPKLLRDLSLSVRSGLITCQLWPPLVVRCTCWVPTYTVVIVRRDRESECPVEAVLQISAGPDAWSGHTSTRAIWRLLSSKRFDGPADAPGAGCRSTRRMLSTGSGIAQPLSPPSIGVPESRVMRDRRRCRRAKLGSPPPHRGGCCSGRESRPILPVAVDVVRESGCPRRRDTSARPAEPCDSIHASGRALA